MDEQHNRRILRPFVKIVHPQISPLMEMGREIVVGKIVKIGIGCSAECSHLAVSLAGKIEYGFTPATLASLRSKKKCLNLATIFERVTKIDTGGMKHPRAEQDKPIIFVGNGKRLFPQRLIDAIDLEKFFYFLFCRKLFFP